MNVVGKFGSLISQGVYSVATPFHPFGGAVDIIVVQQQDGSFRSTPWYVRFGKFQGVLKGAEKIVRISVNETEADFHMFLDNSGEAYFVREIDPGNESDNAAGGILKESGGSSSYNDISKTPVGYRLEHSVSDAGAIPSRDDFGSSGLGRIERSESDVDRRFYDFQDDDFSQEDSVELAELGSSHFENLEDQLLEASPNSEVVLVSVDGHILTAPISASEQNSVNVQLNTPQFHLGPGEGAEFCEGNEGVDSGRNDWDEGYIEELNVSASIGAVSTSGNDADSSVGHLEEIHEGDEECECRDQEAQDVASQIKEVPSQSNFEYASTGIKREEVFKSCLALPELVNESTDESNDSPEGQELSEKISAVECVDESNDSPDGQKLNQNLSAVESVEESIDSIVEQNLSKSLFAANETVKKSDFDEVKIVDELSPSHHIGNGKPKEIDASECIHEELIDTDNMSAVISSDHSSALKESEIANPEAACGNPALAVETTGESQEIANPEDECGQSEIGAEPEAAALSKSIEAESTKIEISLCRHELRSGMGSAAAAEAFDAHIISLEEFQSSMTSIVENENLVIRYQGKYLSWERAAPVVLGIVAFGLGFPVNSMEAIPVEGEETPKLESETVATPTSAGRRWRLWPIPFRRVKTLEHQNSSSSNEDVFVDSEPAMLSPEESTPRGNAGYKSPRKQLIRTNIPTSDQIASLNLKEGQNMITFSFSTRVLGKQQVDAHIYLWKWNAKIVISDVDGTITKSDVLGQFMPLVGKDWTQSGVARLFSAIKENGYQLLFLSARAIVQAYITRNFLLNLKQDGKTLPNGPVVISPDGLFPSLFREVIRRAPHEFKIACLEDIKALFPADYNPFYAGFGNRDTDELSYRKIGIPKGKIFIINPKGEVAISHRIDVRSYTSLHTLVNDMFPPTSLVEQEDYNSWNFWKTPLPEIDC